MFLFSSVLNFIGIKIKELFKIKNPQRLICQTFYSFFSCKMMIESDLSSNRKELTIFETEEFVNSLKSKFYCLFFLS